MRIGLALPQYDFSLPDGISWPAVRDWAVRAEELGFDSVWLSDHLFFEISRYGGPAGPRATMECFTTLAACAAATSRIRVGSLVACNDLRPPSLVAKIAATLDVLSNGRLEIGLGAGWFEAEFREAGLEFRPAGERIARLAEAVQIVAGMLAEEAFSFEGRFYRVRDAFNLPRPVQNPRPPVWVGGKGDKITSVAGRFADGYNSVWAWTPEAYAGRIEVLERASAEAGRDPGSVRRSVGLYCLPGEDRRGLQARWARYVEAALGAIELDGLDAWREDKLSGTPQEIFDRISQFEALGVEEVILGFGALPFQIADPTAVEWFAAEVLPRF